MSVGVFAGAKIAVQNGIGSRQRVGDRRYRGEHWRTLGRGDGERAHLAALNVAELGRRTVEHDRDAPGEESAMIAELPR